MHSQSEQNKHKVGAFSQIILLVELEQKKDNETNAKHNIVLIV